MIYTSSIGDRCFISHRALVKDVRIPDNRVVEDGWIINRQMKLDELTKWVLSVDRRVLVMKEIHENELIKTVEIAEKTGRSLQNISHALRELEGQGLIECLTPEKHTWKRYILTEKGVLIFEKFKKKKLFN